mmetsp:Transcript_44066/g.104272  ORF Transcript_44066/g.104272 Transcript_44066/m.104272 type:complete len:419 (+) Transcript_44066:76-1332(+)
MSDEEPRVQEAPDDQPYDLFGPMYTYDMIMAHKAQKEAAEAAKRAQVQLATTPKPAHWPADTRVDPAPKIFWLPEDWGQGLKTTISGKEMRCYIGPPPDCKRLFHKDKIELYLGRTLPKVPPPAPKTEKKEVADIRTAVPNWPEEIDMPKDWRLAFRRLPSTLHRIYIPPGQDEGFLYQKSEVLEYLNDPSKKLSPFGTSKPMAVISKESKNPNKKRKRDSAEELAASGEHFPLSKQRAEHRLSRDDVWALPKSSEDAKAAFRRYRGLLHCRGFAQGDVEFAYLNFGSTPVAAAGSEEEPGFQQRLQGIYYRMPGVRSMAAFQKLHCTSDELMCDRLYLLHRAKDERWQLCTMLRDDAPVYAYCDAKGKAKLEDLNRTSTWMVAKKLPSTEAASAAPEFAEVKGLEIVCGSEKAPEEA